MKDTSFDRTVGVILLPATRSHKFVPDCAIPINDRIRGVGVVREEQISNVVVIITGGPREIGGGAVERFPPAPTTSAFQRGQENGILVFL